MTNDLELGRRERQIMDAVFRLGRASVSEVRAEIADPPTYSAVRGMLNHLEEKGYLQHERDGLRYLYRPTLAHDDARRSALRHMVRTFFHGSPGEAAAALLELSEAQLSDRERQRLSELIEQAKAEGR